jgi:hypothetical protein
MKNASLASIVAKQTKRYRTLLEMYEITDGNAGKDVHPSTLRERLGLSEDELHRVFDYLDAEGLIKRGASLQISHKGIIEIEDSIQNPNRRTEHFMSVVIQHFYGNVAGGVQGGGMNNVQAVTIKEGE